MKRASTLIVILAGALSAGCPDGTKHATAAAEAPHDGLTLDPSSPQLKFLKIEEVKASDAAASISLTGRITFDEDRTQRVATPIDGRATQLLVKPGDKVQAGQALIALSSPQVGPLQADAQKALQDLSVAQKTADRTRTLRGAGGASDKEVEQADADLQKAKSDVGRTNAQLRSIGISPSDPAVAVSIRAQIAGTIVERNVLVGQEVRADATTPLMTISNLESVWAVADVYEQDLGLVATGATVHLHVPAYPGESFDGKVIYLGDVVDPASRTVKLRCAVPNPTGRLKPEMFAKMELADAGGRAVILVPSKAVLNDAGRFHVIVVDGNVFRMRVVQAGSENEGKVRILEGLRPGEKIVTDGALFLKQDLGEK